MHCQEREPAKNAPAPGVERWLLPVRHFIGTDNDAYLAQAIQACEHPATQAYLREMEHSDEQGGTVPEKMAEKANALVAEWSGCGEFGAVAAVVMLAHRVKLRLAIHNVHALAVDPKLLEHAVSRYVGESLDLARNAGFAECEAAFKHMASQWFARVGDWDPASGAASQAARQYSEVLPMLDQAQDELVLAYMSRSAEVFIHATEIAGHRGDEASAFNAFDTAKFAIDTLRQLGRLDRSFALMIQRAFHLMARLRYFHITCELGKTALAVFRDLNAREPGPSAAYDLALMDHEFARVLVEQGQYEEGESLTVEAISVLEEHIGSETAWWPALTILCGAYTGLAHSRRLRGEKEELLVLYERAADCLRRAVYEGKDPTYTSHTSLAVALVNLSSAHLEAGNFDIASRGFEEADEVRQQIRARAPHVPIQGEWVIDAARSYLLLRTDRSREALELGERAMRLVEAQNVPKHERWMVKGPADQLYALMFDLYARAGDPMNAFRCLRALRNGSLATGEEAAEGLDAVLVALQEAARGISGRIVLLCPQDLKDGRMRMGILDSHDGFRTVDCSTFVHPARCMEAHLEAEYASNWLGKDESALEHAAETAWEALPEEVRACFRVVERTIVLICGDSLWSNFPWEGLKTGPGVLDALGMHIPLVRHASLDVASFSALTEVIIGGSTRLAAVVCPWNVPEEPLPSARDEAEAVASILVCNGYAGVAGTLLRAGGEARPEGMAEAIASRPDVLHYCGHGVVRNGEEALALLADGAAVPFGRREVDAVIVQAGVRETPPPLGLTVLNCCYGGRVRSHGGRREDLVATMMRAGATVVVASAMPLDDVSAAVFGICIHHPSGRGDETVAKIVARARRIVAACVREAGLPSWPAWAHVTCHGNPLAVYRRGGATPANDMDASALAEQIVSFLRPAEHDRSVLAHRIRAIMDNDLAAT